MSDIQSQTSPLGLALSAHLPDGCHAWRLWACDPSPGDPDVSISDTSVAPKRLRQRVSSDMQSNTLNPLMSIRLTPSLRQALCAGALVVAACGSTTDGTTGTGTRTTSSSSSGTSEDEDQEPTPSASCTADGSVCSCSVGRSPTGSQQKVTSCNVDTTYRYCCAYEDDDGVIECNCYGKYFRAGCIGGKREVTSCSGLAYRKRSTTATNNGCQSDYDCEMYCRAGERALCSKASGYGTCSCI